MRIAWMGFSWIWATGLVLLGLFAWKAQADVYRLKEFVDADVGLLVKLVKAVAFWFIAAGEFLFIVLVAEPAVPRCPANVSVFFKTVAGALFWLALAAIGFLVYEILR